MAMRAIFLVSLSCFTLASRSAGAFKVAIVGAGAGGSSAAYWIKKAQERNGLNIEVDVFEKSGYVGGRSTVVHPYNDTSYRPVELGASIFIEANKNLWRAADEFGLTRITPDSDTEAYGLGIWDGNEVLLDLSGTEDESYKIVDRYGIDSLVTSDGLVGDMYNSYVNVYTTHVPVWQKISDLSSSLGFSSLTTQTLAKYFEANNVSDKYTFELGEGALRVNYGQNADAIHALEGLASQSPPYDSASIQGGNFQVFQKFLDYSGAKVHLNTVVKSIQSVAGKWVVTTKSGTGIYDAVILAAPFHQTGIIVPPKISSSIPKQSYVHLHVTLISTTQGNANPAYFNLAANETTPQMMLTTNNRVRAGLPGPHFNSISYHGKISDTESYVKIFSSAKITDAEIHKLFDNVGWVYRKEWDAYPVLSPTSTFPPVKLDKGFYYVNAMEPFFATMETETISSRNIVDLLLNESFGGVNICGKTRPAPNDDWNYVYGFDC